MNKNECEHDFVELMDTPDGEPLYDIVEETRFTVLKRMIWYKMCKKCGATERDYGRPEWYSKGN